MVLAPDLDSAVIVGWPAAERVLGFDGHPTVIYLKVYEPQMDAVRTVLPATVYPELPGMVQVSRPSDALAAKRATQSTFSVLEHRREIGLRRALGANDRAGPPW